jgi:hypothetical protein
LLKDLAALTPPAVVCAAFLIGLVLLLRREMAPKRRVREDSGSEHDISGNNGIIGTKAPTSAAGSDEHGDAARSPDGDAR